MTKYRERREAGEYLPKGAAAAAAPEAAADEGSELDSMTKDELLAYAQSLGVSPANAAMTKGEIRAGVDAHLAKGDG